MRKGHIILSIYLTAAAQFAPCRVVSGVKLAQVLQWFPTQASGRKEFVFRKISATLDALATYQSFTRPIFIISPPRSGSTLLFECLSRDQTVYHFQYEADRIWWSLFPYRKMKKPSDYTDLNEIDSQKLRLLRKRTYQEATEYFRDKLARKAKLTYKYGIERIRYLDKTIANCFHLDIIDRAFPNAEYLFLVRDPRANISSMMDSWGKPEFSKPQLAQILSEFEQKTIDTWTYPAPPGWQEVLSCSLSQICAWSWRQHIEFALAFFNRRSQPFLRVQYEDLVDQPTLTLQKISQALALEINDPMMAKDNKLPLSRTTVSVPDPNKWKQKNYDAIVSILPDIEKTALQIGYDVYADLKS